jgi:hypothetical protein
MKQRHLTITLQPDWRAALRSAGAKAKAATYQGERLNFESPAIRELARRVGRDVKRVHEDVQVLAELGLVERTEGGGVVCPFAEVHIDMRLLASEVATA